MTEYIYKSYEENKGFEEFQAEIYNSVANKFGAQTVTGEAIKKRMQDHKPDQDRNGITFVFDNNMKPVAYIQYREYAQGKVRIGYPWAKEGTPQEVKDKLFYDLFDYLKIKYPETKKFYLGFINHAFSNVIEEVTNYYGFKEDTTFAAYALDIEKASSLNIPSDYSFKEATASDIDLLIEIDASNGNKSKLSKEKLKEFFEKHFTLDNKEQLTIILSYHDNEVGIIALSKIKQKDKDYFSVRLLSLKNDNETLYQYIFSATGKIMNKKGLNYPITLNFIKSQEEKEELFKKLGGEFVSKAYEFCYEL